FSWVPAFKRTTYVEVSIPAGTTYQQRAAMVDKAVEQELGKPLGEGQMYGVIKPFLRSVNTDINSPLSYAIWSAIFVEFWGITALGFFKYGSKFINFGRLLKGDLFNGAIDVFVGILEFVSEIARIISFTSRLFGNISAGEILLFMISFLVPLALVDVFYSLELLFGAIQAFIF